MSLRVTILGCGSSGGVPRLGGDWGACDPAEPKNRRRRCSVLVEKVGPDGTTQILIDTSPDLREQLLGAGVGRLDAVVWTHPHADHTHGLDDLRMIVYNMRAKLPVWADPATSTDLRARFGYAFETPQGSGYPPILDMNQITGDFAIDGPGGRIRISPLQVEHGRIHALGFRIDGMVYMPDVSDIPDDIWPLLKDLDLWIIDALRREPHSSHAHLDRTLDWIARANPRQAVITNMHVDLDYATLVGELPAGVSPAWDNRVLTLG